MAVKQPAVSFELQMRSDLAEETNGLYWNSLVTDRQPLCCQREAFFLLALMPLKAARQDCNHVWLHKNPLFMLGHNLEDRPLT